MPRPQAIADSLATLLDGSPRPTYVVDPQRRIVYCNHALAEWIDLPAKRIVGRRVEFHSEEPTSDAAVRSDTAPLTDLCPPPSALTGEPGGGTISCTARDGRMLHRRAEFVPLGRTKLGRRSLEQNEAYESVLVLLAENDLSPHEVASEVSAAGSVDALHLTIRKFRRNQAKRYSIKSLLGSSPAMQKVRAQVEAAAISGANTLIDGRPGSGRTHVALAIHYRAAPDGDAPLIRVNCELLSDSVLDQTLDRLRAAKSPTTSTPTLMLENLERMSGIHQALLFSAIASRKLDARILATVDLAYVAPESANGRDRNEPPTTTSDPPATIADENKLLNIISTITIRAPRIVERIEDLPVLTQFFLEACNRGSTKQVGGLKPDALDALALYSWPGELVQLQQVIEAAHAACTSSELSAANLPPTFFHAFRSAAHVRREPDRIVLDDLLANIEREAITRALAQTSGNKTEAAALIGMTRPRLYRRLVQLGFIPEGADDPTESPEFIEEDPAS